MFLEPGAQGLWCAALLGPSWEESPYVMLEGPGCVLGLPWPAGLPWVVMGNLGPLRVPLVPAPELPALPTSPLCLLQAMSGLSATRPWSCVTLGLPPTCPWSLLGQLVPVWLPMLFWVVLFVWGGGGEKSQLHGFSLLFYRLSRQ